MFKRVKKSKETELQSSAVRIMEVIKKDYPDHILLLRVGDSFEAVDGDAAVIAEIGGLTAQEVIVDGKKRTLAGMPTELASEIIQKIILAGHTVTLAEPKDSNGLFTLAHIAIGGGHNGHN